MPPLKPTKTAAPRPGQNADGQRKQPQAAPQGATMPQLQPGGFAGVSDMPGLPPDVQGFPSDMKSLQRVMMQGYAPGSSTMEHRAAMNATAVARAQENQAVDEAFEQEDDHMKIQQLGMILQSMMKGPGVPGGLAQLQPSGGAMMGRGGY